jgi:hypothetical protein
MEIEANGSKSSHACVVYSAATMTLTLTAWMVLAQAQTQPPAQTQYPLEIPNTGQQINPFAPTDSQSSG